MHGQFHKALLTYTFEQVSKVILVLRHAEWDVRVGFDPAANVPRQRLWLHSPNNKPWFAPLGRQSGSGLL